MGKRKRQQQPAEAASSEPNTNWDINGYRTAYEPEEHWELRRTFMERHQHWIAEDELVCLAQVFVNVELLHCRYPLETMERLRELSKGVADEYRNSRKNKLQRTFVSASDAAASKVQRKGPGEQVKQQQQKGPIQFVSGSSRTHQMVAPIRTLADVYNNLVLMHNDYECTQQEFDRMGCGNKLEIELSRGGNGKTVGRISVGQFELARAEGDSEKTTRKAVKLAFLEAMGKHCYKIVRKKHAVHLANSKVERKAVQGTVDHRGRKVVNDFQEQKIDSSNLGFKLLQKLGWSGGSLGSKNEGIVDPINCQIKIGRQGLGGGAPAKKEQPGGGPPKKGKIDTRNETYGIDINFYRQTMKNFRDSGIEYDMVFSKDFTKEERALFHNMALQLQLKTRSFGKDTDGSRQFVLLGRKLSPHEILERVLVEKDPIFSEMYEVTGPASDQQQDVVDSPDVITIDD
ncbi:uncharacterized protein LOC120431540 [Culex pipiens pallens]|uniref:uncharacterized protein LOC120431540 n=1 Tax=Culex pipiens pallens TaxID=42434 RepID=UPI001952A64D|nr:uncharacterized protein LOC120431540 [Culex pipiens pallens]